MNTSLKTVHLFFGLLLRLVALGCAVLFMYAYTSVLSENTLAEDLVSLCIGFGDIYNEELQKGFCAENVQVLHEHLLQ